jgi:hypothetical protein
VRTENIGVLLNVYNSALSNETALWAMYVAATFAAAGFGISSDSLNDNSKVFVIVGFIAFSIGQFFMVRLSLLKRRVIQSTLKLEKDHEIHDVIDHIIREGVGTIGALMTHLVIGVCVVKIILSNN